MLVYIAHPLGLSADAIAPRVTIKKNLRLAKQWLRWAIRTYPEQSFMAPWVTTCEVLDDKNAADRARGMAMNGVFLSRCEEVWLCGPRLSAGMREEGITMASWGHTVRDCTPLAFEVPPADGVQMLWRTWTASDYATQRLAHEAHRNPPATDRPMKALRGLGE